MNGISRLKEAYNYDLNNKARSKKELDLQWDWVMARAKQYADYFGTTPDTVLDVWESKRRYWWLNYYQECNQPDLSKRQGILTFNDWVAEGEKRFGKEKLDWKFVCPNCGHVQTMRDFQNADIDPQRAYQVCASRYNIGGKSTCKWSAGGLFCKEGQWVISQDYTPVLIFSFAN